MDTALTAAVPGGSPPDVALVPDPGTLDTLAKAERDQGPHQHPREPHVQLRQRVEHARELQRQAVRRVVQGREQEHHLVQPGAVHAAGISSPPTSWEQLLTDAAQLKAAGITPFSLCTDVGWPVADFWQNIYLKTAGAADYNKLAAHALKWTDPTVTTAFTTMAQLVGQPSIPARWTQGSLSNAYPTCVDKVFPKPPASPRRRWSSRATSSSARSRVTPPTTPRARPGRGGAACTAERSGDPVLRLLLLPGSGGGQREQHAPSRAPATWR